MGKKITIIVLLIIVLLVGGWYFFYEYEQEDPVEEETEEEVAEKEEDVEEKDDPYEVAEEVAPMSDRNVAMDKDLREIFEEVFGEDPKLTESGEILALSYVVNRNITSDDVSEVKDMLEDAEHGDYEVVGTESQENEYELNLSAEIEGEEYNNNIYIRLFTDEEGEKSQRIEVRFL